MPHYEYKHVPLTAYQQRVNAANLAAQAPPVQAKVREILEELHDIERCLYWALESEEFSSNWPDNLIEHAHALLDLGHEYKAALKADPPPRMEDES